MLRTNITKNGNNVKMKKTRKEDGYYLRFEVHIFVFQQTGHVFIQTQKSVESSVHFLGDVFQSEQVI